MKQTTLLSAALLALCAAIVFGSLQISGAILAAKVTAPPPPVQTESSRGAVSSDILTADEAAAYLGIERRALDSLVEYSHLVDGRGIPYYIMDGVVRFSKSALDEWIKLSAENRLPYGEVSPG